MLFGPCTNSICASEQPTATKQSRWETEVIGLLQERVVELNRGKWPSTVSEWGEVGERLDLSFRFVRIYPSGNAVQADGRCYLSYPGRSVVQIMAHEVCEAALISESIPPYIVPVQPMKQARHRIAVKASHR